MQDRACTQERERLENGVIQPGNRQQAPHHPGAIGTQSDLQQQIGGKLVHGLLARDTSRNRALKECRKPQNPGILLPALARQPSFGLRTSDFELPLHPCRILMSPSNARTASALSAAQS
jgi:hypothetical protein